MAGTPDQRGLGGDAGAQKPPNLGGEMLAVVRAGTGAPSNNIGANGDIYFRIDGGALTTIYQRRAGAYVGIV